MPTVVAGVAVEIHGNRIGTALNQLPSGAIVVAGFDGERYLVRSPRDDRAWLLIERLGVNG